MKDISDAMGNFGNNASLMKAHRMTKMILVLVGIFALCNSLQNLNQWLKNDIVECIGDLMLIINSSINGIIYGIFNKKFRDAFLSCNSSLKTYSVTSDVVFDKRGKNMKMSNVS